MHPFFVRIAGNNNKLLLFYFTISWITHFSCKKKKKNCVKFVILFSTSIWKTSKKKIYHAWNFLSFFFGLGKNSFVGRKYSGQISFKKIVVNDFDELEIKIIFCQGEKQEIQVFLFYHTIEYGNAHASWLLIILYNVRSMSQVNLFHIIYILHEYQKLIYFDY